MLSTRCCLRRRIADSMVSQLLGRAWPDCSASSPLASGRGRSDARSPKAPLPSVAWRSRIVPLQVRPRFGGIVQVRFEFRVTRAAARRGDGQSALTHPPPLRQDARASSAPDARLRQCRRDGTSRTVDRRLVAGLCSARESGSAATQSSVEIRDVSQVFERPRPLVDIGPRHSRSRAPAPARTWPRRPSLAAARQRPAAAGSGHTSVGARRRSRVAGASGPVNAERSPASGRRGEAIHRVLRAVAPRAPTARIGVWWRRRARLE